MKIIILGPQGSGKGTQATLIADYFHIPTFSVGEMFRNEIKKNTALGRRVAKLVNGGKMVPDGITNQIVKKSLRRAVYRRGVILDGYPRTLFQAKFLQIYWKPHHVIFLDVPERELLKRLRDRLVCVGCSLTFHKKYKPSELKELCEACNGKLERRKDDNPKAIRERLKIYQKETVPVIRFYEKLGFVRRINGNQSIDAVWKDIAKRLQ